MFTPQMEKMVLEYVPILEAEKRKPLIIQIAQTKLRDLKVRDSKIYEQIVREAIGYKYITNKWDVSKILFVPNVSVQTVVKPVERPAEKEEQAPQVEVALITTEVTESLDEKKKAPRTFPRRLPQLLQRQLDATFTSLLKDETPLAIIVSTLNGNPKYRNAVEKDFDLDYVINKKHKLGLGHLGRKQSK